MSDLPIFYNEADEWARAMFLYDSALKELNTRLDIWNKEFKLIHQYNPIEHVTSRIKSPQSIAKKMRKRDLELNIRNIMDYVNDIAGIRIICSFTADIYRIADLLEEQADIKILKIKDYIQYPKENGYMSYHMIVAVPVALSSGVVDTKVEIQIRTIAMDFWASLEHKIYYKFEGKAPSHIRRELKECADLVSFLDRKMLSINEEVRMLSEQQYSEYEESEYAHLTSKHETYTKSSGEQKEENTSASGNPAILDADYIEKQTDESGLNIDASATTTDHHTLVDTEPTASDSPILAVNRTKHSWKETLRSSKFRS